MGKNVTFYLGPAIGLSSRQLTITRKGDRDGLYTAEHDADAGAVENVTVALTDNLMYEAKIVDTKSTGEVSETRALGFHTGSLQFPGPAGEGDTFYVYAMEDLSSSSSSSSSETSSSSSSSSVTSSSSGTSSSSSSSSATSSSSSSSLSSSSSSSQSSSSSSVTSSSSSSSSLSSSSLSSGSSSSSSQSSSSSSSSAI